MKEIKSFEEIEHKPTIMRTDSGSKLTISSTEPLELGKLMKVSDPVNGKYLIRIADHTNGTNQNDPTKHRLINWMMEGQKLLWTNEAFLLGKVENGGLTSFQKKPSEGCPVRELEEDIFHFEQPYFAEEKGNEDVKIGIHPETITNHIAILGKTNSGKTNTGAVLLSQIHGLKKGIPVVAESSFSLIKLLARDYYAKSENNNFTLLSTSEYNREKLLGWGIEEKRVKELKIDPNELTPEVICMAGSVGENTRYRGIIYNTYRNADDKGSWFGELEKKLESVSNEKTKEALGRTIDQIKRKPWVGKDGMNIYRVLEKSIEDEEAVLIDLDESRGALRPVGVLLTDKLNKLCKRRKREGESNIPVLLALDEAHQWLDKDKKETNTKFIRTIKMVRKWGMGMMFMTQQVSNMDSRFFDQVGGLTVCHGAGSEDEAGRMKRQFTNEVDKEEILESNEKGEGIYEADTENSLNIAMRIQVFGPFEEWIKDSKYKCKNCGEEVRLYELAEDGERCKNCAREDLETFM